MTESAKGLQFADSNDTERRCGCSIAPIRQSCTESSSEPARTKGRVICNANCRSATTRQPTRSSGPPPACANAADKAVKNGNRGKVYKTGSGLWPRTHLPPSFCSVQHKVTPKLSRVSSPTSFLLRDSLLAIVGLIGGEGTMSGASCLGLVLSPLACLPFLLRASLR